MWLLGMIMIEERLHVSTLVIKFRNIGINEGLVCQFRQVTLILVNMHQKFNIVCDVKRQMK